MNGDWTGRMRAHLAARWMCGSLALAVGTFAGGLWAPIECRAQASTSSQLSELNLRVTAGRGLKDASAILFPTLVAMTESPDIWMSERQATLMTPKSADWGAWSAWAAGEAQQAVLEGLKTVTDPKERYTIGIPYGRDGVDPAWVAAGLYVELGSPALVGRATNGMHYLDRLTGLATLCTIESARRAEAGDGAGSMRVLVNWLRLSRMVADREFLPEKLWGMTNIVASTERMRDIAYLYPELLTEKETGDAVTELDLRSLTPERIRFPDGERQGLLELLSLTMKERGGTEKEKFAATMGRMTVEQREMEAFSGAAYWAKLEPTHGGWFDTKEEITKVFGAWQQRWDINNIFDPLMREPTDYSQMDQRKFAMVDELVRGIESLFDLRTRMMVAITGTRTAMGVVGFRSRFKQWPPSLAAVQPQFVKSIDNDPWGFDQKLEIRSIFRYFVPIRDAVVGPRDTPGPHQMHVMIVRDETLASVAPSAGDPSGGAFPPFVARAFRDALADGIPSRLIDAETGDVRLAAFKTYLEAEVAKLAIVPATVKQLQEIIKGMSESDAMAVVMMVDASKAMGGRAKAMTGEMQAAIKQMNEALGGNLADIIKTEDGKFDATAFRTQAIEGIKASTLPQELKDAIVAQLDKLTNAELTLAFETVRSAAGGSDGPMVSFEVSLTDSTFVIYSVGIDGRAGGAKAVGNAAGASDILVFPAPISLEREHLASRN